MCNIRVLICDDHQMMIDGLQLLLSRIKNITVAGQAHNGQEAIEWIEKNETDIILMDINMPIMNGLEACKILLKGNQDIKVIFLSMINQSTMIHSLIESGAKGYLLKNSGEEELSQAINKVYNGGVYFDEKLFLVKDKAKKSFSNNFIPKITKREKEVLALILKEYTSSEIAEELFIGIGTVETHRRNLISKLAVKNTAGLVRVAMEYGLVKD